MHEEKEREATTTILERPRQHPTKKIAMKVEGLWRR
jgi:hypothetical protein